MNKFVVAGGWSAGQYPRLDDLYTMGEVIGVNDSAIETNVHTAFTMDRKWFENRWEKLHQCDEVWVRRKCDCNVPQDRKFWRTFEHLNVNYPSDQEGILHGGNSGTCAINLAMQTMYEGDRLFLFGFDMQAGPNGEPYWYKPYAWAIKSGASQRGTAREWIEQLRGFDDYAREHQLAIYNVTCRSALNCFQRIDFEQFEGIL